MTSLAFSNDTAGPLVPPQFFHISGFSNMPYSKYYVLFLCFLYIVTVLGNTFVTFIIYLFRSLHTPKYMAIFSLAAADLGESTALMPNFVITFLSNTQQITYEACMANMFFVFLFNSMQSLTLSLLAYDRFVAICFPLRYHNIVTNTSMAIIIAMTWLMNLLFICVGIGLITRLSFCKSTVIDSYFCDHGPVYRLACNDNSPNITMARIFIVIHLFFPLFLIGFSYISILLALLKIASWEESIKALKTCFSHLILVSVFYLPILGIYFAVSAVSIHPNARIISTSLSYAIPPVLNPIVYSLNTAEIKEFVKKMFQRNRHKGIIPAVSK